MESSEDEDEPRESRVGGDSLEPVVVDVEQHHLRLGGLEDQVPELLDLEARLEGQLQLRALCSGWLGFHNRFTKIVKNKHYFSDLLAI